MSTVPYQRQASRCRTRQSRGMRKEFGWRRHVLGTGAKVPKEERDHAKDTVTHLDSREESSEGIVME